ncbi:MAG: biotin--[acetyl-CoA-carboxylase] ligase [Methylophilaceae bacterium]|nr:biotin--[acetyl-CoA-carboxylase] ligase [Methylophilaceae bacterium]
MNPLTFPLLRLLADGQFRSGEALARHFGVTRATVWNAVQQAERMGVKVYSVRGRGYRLPTPVDFLDHQRVRGHLAGLADRLWLQFHEVTDSTNTLLMRLASEGAPHGTCVVAELQRNGRGRRGRMWHSGLGSGLTFSLLWRFDQGASALNGLSLAVGVALARALEELGMPEILLKWPNDVQYRHRKLAGILIELQGDAFGPSAAVIGVGLNVRQPAEVHVAIGHPVASLEEIWSDAIDRNYLLAVMLRHMVAVLDEFGQVGFRRLRDEWQARHAYHQQKVRLLLPDGTETEAMVQGVDEDGALLADAGAGPQRYASAEISLRGNVA